MGECDDRQRRRSARPTTGAGSSRKKWLPGLDHAPNPRTQPAGIAQPAACACGSRGGPLGLTADTGTGERHLLMGLGAAAGHLGGRARPPSS